MVVIPFSRFDNQFRIKLIQHPLFEYINKSPQLTSQVEFILGQYWYLLHFFPTFLARLIPLSSSLSIKTDISKILYQELGEGSLSKAHEQLYLNMIKSMGVEKDLTTQPMLPATKALLKGYEKSSQRLCSGLGFLYATEIIDLTMVLAIGRGVRKVSNATSTDLSWIEIHQKQEPEHVECANSSLQQSFSKKEEKEITSYGELCWKLWDNFYSEILITLLKQESSLLKSTIVESIRI